MLRRKLRVLEVPRTHSGLYLERKKMMNDKQFENKVNRDVENAKNDLATLGDDSITGLNRKIEQLTDDTKKSVDAAAKTVNKAVGQGLNQYNAKLQEFADKVPGDFGKKAAGYPWVTMTISLIFGLLLGVLLKPGRQPAG
jgi:ElaB/YqjD/DUF883 family membrane-anchored ribosome-binding protein